MLELWIGTLEWGQKEPSIGLLVYADEHTKQTIQVDRVHLWYNLEMVVESNKNTAVIMQIEVYCCVVTLIQFEVVCMVKFLCDRCVYDEAIAMHAACYDNALHFLGLSNPIAFSLTILVMFKVSSIKERY